MKRFVQHILLPITAVAAWSGLLIQLLILVLNTPQNGMTVIAAIGHFFRFFTILSNLLVAISLSSLYLKKSNFLTRPVALSAIAVYIFVVALVYNLILRQLWAPEGWQAVADNLLHVGVPLAYLICWWHFSNKPLAWKYALVWLSFPAIYLFYALLRGRLDSVYPYPFIDLSKLGAQQVAINSFAMLLLFVVCNLLFIALSRWQSRKFPNLNSGGRLQKEKDSES